MERNNPTKIKRSVAENETAVFDVISACNEEVANVSRPDGEHV